MIANWFLATVPLALAMVSVAAGQTRESAPPDTAPPKLVVLVYQKFPIAKTSERDKILIATARAYDHLTVPNSWIALEAITGEPEVLWFDPFDSFAHIHRAFSEWGTIYAAHPELARLQQQINGALTSQRTVIAVRREDLSYRANAIDLSKERFMRVLEVRLRPGHENDFAEAFQKLSAAYEKTASDLPWVVYQVNAGMPSPAFFVFVPMKVLGQNDDLLAQRERLREAEGEAAERMQQIAREAYASTESHLYAISPEKSVVSKELAAGDPQFWTRKAQTMPQPMENKSPAKGSTPKNKKSKPKQ